MHSNDCVHQDVKLEHVLLDSEGNVKLLDFGMSIIVDEETEYTEVCGTAVSIIGYCIWCKEDDLRFSPIMLR